MTRAVRFASIRPHWATPYAASISAWPNTVPRSRFPPSPVSALPDGDGHCPWQIFYAATDVAGEVRGGYALKHQQFRIADRTVHVADLRIPISEGCFDPAYTQLGVHLLLDAVKRQPLLYGLGMGGLQEPVARLLRAAGWKFSPVPFFFRVNHAGRFLRQLAYVPAHRPSTAACWTCWPTAARCVALRSLQFCRTRPMASALPVAVHWVDDFGPWADDLRRRCEADYRLVAVRDAGTLHRLYPPENPAFLRLQLSREGRPFGWALLLDTQLAGHRQFGDMRLGSIVDGLACAADVGTLVPRPAEPSSSGTWT